MPDRPASQVGVVYVAFGEMYRQSTLLSVSYLRRFGYSGPVRILTDTQDWHGHDPDCEILAVPSIGEGFATRYYKTQINTYGYATTLFLDADTLPLSSISPIWRELRFAEMCMATDYHPNVRDLVVRGTKSRERRQAEFNYMSDLGLLNHRFYNSGVMLFRRSSATDQLFAIWHEEWNRFRHEDQPALVRAMVRTGLKVRTLAPCWNARLRGLDTIGDTQLRGARILHLRPGNEPLLSRFLDESFSAHPGFGRQLQRRFAFWARKGKRAVEGNLAWVRRRVGSFWSEFARRLSRPA